MLTSGEPWACEVLKRPSIRFLNTLAAIRRNSHYACQRSFSVKRRERLLPLGCRGRQTPIRGAFRDRHHTFMVTVWTTTFDADEFPAVSDSSGVALRALPILGSYLYDNCGDILNEALRDDLIIVSLSGHNPSQIVSGLIDAVGHTRWRQRKARVVVRTQDSHHQVAQELSILDDVDFVGIAHSNYLRHFPPTKVLHVPCSLHQSRSLAAQWIKKTPTEHTTDVAFPFQLYRGESRNALSYEVLRQLEHSGVSTNFGFFRYYNMPSSPPRLWEELGRARVILNLPLRDDFNIRNFEASLFPAWHVTPQLPDHDRVAMDWSNTVFSDADPDALVATILGLLEQSNERVPSANPREVVLDNHVANDRVYQIVDHIFGTSLHTQPKTKDANATINQKPVIIERYSPARLLEMSPTVFTRSPSNALYQPPLQLRLRATLRRLMSIPARIRGRFRSPMRPAS